MLVKHMCKQKASPLHSIGTPDLEALYWKQQGQCSYCNDPLCGVADLEHLIPRSRGGQHTLENLVWACPSCNGSKKDKTEEEFRRELRARPKHYARKRARARALRTFPGSYLTALVKQDDLQRPE